MEDISCICYKGLNNTRNSQFVSIQLLERIEKSFAKDLRILDNKKLLSGEESGDSP